MNLQVINFAKIRFLKSIREPFTAIMLVFNVLVVFITSLLPLFTFDKNSEIKAHLEIAFQSTFIITLIVGIYHASNSVYQEMEDRTIFTIFSKPINKFSYLLGNMIGIALLMLCFYVIGSILEDFMVFLEEVTVKDRKCSIKDVFYGYLSREYLGVQLTHAPVLKYFFLSFLSTLPLLAISVSLSPFTPFLMNLSLCASLFALGNLLPSLEWLENSLGQILRHIVPRMDLFDLTDSLVLESPPNSTLLGLCLLYAVAYSLLWLTAGSYLLSRKEFA